MISTGMYTLKFTEESGGTRLRENRLYATKQEADFVANIHKSKNYPHKKRF